MVVVYWQSTCLDPIGSWSYARYETEAEMYPVSDTDRSWWIVPGTLED